MRGFSLLGSLLGSTGSWKFSVYLPIVENPQLNQIEAGFVLGVQMNRTP